MRRAGGQPEVPAPVGICCPVAYLPLGREQEGLKRGGGRALQVKLTDAFEFAAEPGEKCPVPCRHQAPK